MAEALADLVYEKMRRLPEPTQQEVLRFVEYLLFQSRQENILWSQFSLAMALRGLEDESWPEYGEADLKEKWQ